MIPRIPRRFEALLESLGADSAFTREVLGDLAEEFFLRCTWDGERSARRWYRREAFRTAPYLLREWRRRFNVKDLESVTGAVLWSLLAGVAFQATLNAGINNLSLWLTDVPFSTWYRHWIGIESSIPTAISLSMFTLVGLCIGYTAASIGKRAPMPSGLTSTASVAAVMLVTGLHLPGGFVIACTATAATATLAGTLLRCIRVRRGVRWA
jgi:hypothetical protein